MQPPAILIEKQRIGNTARDLHASSTSKRVRARLVHQQSMAIRTLLMLNDG